MDKETIEDAIDKFVIPSLDEFVETESSFFLYVMYEEDKAGVKSLITPAPPFEVIDQVMKEVAKKVYEEMHGLPVIIIACEKIKFLEKEESELVEGEESEVNIDLLDSGVVILALEAQTAEGLVSIYSMPDLELIISKEFDMDGEEAPPYTTVAITAFMQETLVQAGLREEEDDGAPDNDGGIESKAEVSFRFSRN
jgi:hypothetical protein